MVKPRFISGLQWYNHHMSMSDFDLRPSGKPRPEYTIAGDAQDDASPYLTLQALDDEVRDLRDDSYAAVAGATAAKTTSALADAFRGGEARTRVDTVRRALAAAVDAWWRTNALPPDTLLRDGLLVLEAGHPLDEAQRTLLARTALARGHGIFTALRHQTDPARVATLVHEAVMEGTLTPNGLRALLVDDSLDPQWIAALQSDLQADLASPVAALRAQVALNLISAAFWKAAPGDAPATTTLNADPPNRAWVRIVVAALLLAALAVLWFWRTRATDYGDVIEVPAGAYLVSGDPHTMVQLALPAFVIDRTEVTVAAWHDCVNAGPCAGTSPEGLDSSPDPARAQHPVTGVAWEDAQRFCNGRAMRLPSAAEWEVAAGYAPATDRTWRFPWGEAWEPAFVIGGAENAFTSTAPVGSRSPQGDSPMGAADMAGNAAEWTSSPAPGALDQALVKGGSFQDAAAAHQVSAAMVLPKSSTTAWLGFRCAAGLAENRP